MLQISLSKKLFNLMNHAPTKRENIDHLPFQPMQVFSQLTFICIEVKFTIGAHAVTPKTHHSVMVNASGLSLDADLYNSMSQSPDITNSATANFHQMLHSATVLTSTLLNGLIINTEVSGVFGELSHSGDASDTGCSPSTSERKIET